jgi:serine/threonine-protein kinase
MSPEQAQSKPVDVRSDIYSLGSTLFELLCAQPLHPGMTVPALIRSTITGADARISKRFPDSDVPLELEAICVRATRTSPEDRFSTAREMHDAIERFLEGDRDLEHRRKRSVEHARAARKLARAAGKQTKKHAAAMREVGRALALDPDNADAMRTMIALLTDPPKTLPRAVEREMKDDLAKNVLAARRLAGFGFVTPIVPSLIVLMMGVRDWRWFALSLGTGILAAIVSVFPKDAAAGPRRWLTIAAATIGLLATSRLAGAFVAVPVLSFGLAIGLLLFPRAFPLRWAIAVGWLPILLPLALERLGVLAPIYEFSGNTLSIHGQFAAFPELATTGYFLLITLAPIAAVCVYLARIRERADAAERRLRLMAWQLRQIVPK